jgi:PHIKZ165
MLVKRLELYRYKRFFLSQVDRFILEPKSNIMIMAWGNGKGKSSLLSQLNPLPAEIKRDFKEGGYKILECLHRGKEYRLSSGVDGAGKHSFICNDVELNPGYTKRVQLELVYEHFKITPAIEEILLGNVNLTTMSPSVRKYWFSELSTIDYNYAIGVYNQLKSRARDISGGIKLEQDELIRLGSEVKSDDELKRYEDEQRYIESYVNYVLSVYDHTVHSLEDSTDISSNIDRLIACIGELLSNDRVTYEQKYYQEAIMQQRASYELLEAKIKKTNQELDLLNAESDAKSYEEIDRSRRDVISKLLKLRANKLGIRLRDITEVCSSYFTLYPNLVELVGSLSEVSGIEVSNESISTREKEVVELSSKIDRMVKQVNLAEGELANLTKLNTEEDIATCPNCSHRFHVHLDPIRYSKLKEAIPRAQELLKIEQEKLSKHTKELEDMKLVKSTIASILKLLNTPILQPILKDIYSKIDLNSKAPYILSLLDKYKLYLDTLNSYPTLRSKLVELRYQRLKIKELNEFKASVHNANIASLNKELSDVTIAKLETKELLDKLSNELTKITKLDEYKSRLYKLVKEAKAERDNSIRVYRNECISKLVTELKSYLSELAIQANKAKDIKASLDKAKTNLDSYKLRAKLLDIVLTKLSPSEGIIARSINSFLNIFLGEMNHIINSVWSYDMVLLPCDITEDNDLDYKFKVRVNNDEVIEDVGKLSSSMQEIVNLAYKIVFMKYMGLSDHPLILDEFGRTMDATHRTAAYNIIDQVFLTNFEQIFLVSHFESMYGRFANAHIVNLEDE